MGQQTCCPASVSWVQTRWWSTPTGSRHWPRFSVGIAAELAREQGLGDEKPSDQSGVPLHPLLDRVRTSGRTELYETDFAPAEHWLLDEHRVRDGTALIPGTGYLELARAALSECPEDRHRPEGDAAG